MNEELAPDPDLMESSPEIHSQEFHQFQEMIETGQGEINSRLLKEAREQNHITKEELGELALALLEKIEPRAEKAGLDGLTGLYNRGYFNEKLDTTIEELRFAQENRRETPIQSLMVIFLDMNLLKNLNDTYGHEAGDQGLVALANRFKETIKSTDTVARWGGDEFLILLSVESSEENIHEEIFQRIKEAISGLTIDIQNQEGETIQFPIEVTMGYSVLDKTNTQTTAEELKKQADEAMYQNKREMKK